jgi:hypothetical protein
LVVERKRLAMKLRRMAVHIIIFVAVIVAISALSIWLGTGPVLLSPDPHY